MSDLGIVVIGRNEGERLVGCPRIAWGGTWSGVRLRLQRCERRQCPPRAGASVVGALDVSVPLAVRRERANAGIAALRSRMPQLAYVQTIDGDCELLPNWLPVASAFLDAEPEIAVVLGRLRERFPTRSIYNVLCDHEWDGPVVSKAPACGGIALIRLAALDAAGGYRTG